MRLVRTADQRKPPAVIARPRIPGEARVPDGPSSYDQWRRRRDDHPCSPLLPPVQFEPERRLERLERRRARDWESSYRERWQHDRIVRSTHGVNCTGSCSWQVHVKQGIVTWETQQTDYPENGADVPDYEPRGCPRGASFSWYVYSPLRIRYPYVRGALLERYREELARTGDPVEAWAAIVDDPERARRVHLPARQGRFRARLVGRGGRHGRRRPRAHHPPLGPRPGGRLLADPGDVDGLLLRRHALLLADGRGAHELLRLVRRPAARLAAGVGRPDRRARVGRLVERRPT